jgi:hypothetical protein
MGEDRVREYRISGAMLSEGPLRLAVAYMLMQPDGHTVHAWPQEVRDGCAAAELVHGSTPEELVFEPESWSALELVPTDGSPRVGRLEAFHAPGWPRST